MKDIGRIAKAFGTCGQNISKASLAYDSGWLDLRNETGQEYVITHNLNETELQVDAREYRSGWNQTYGGTDADYAKALVQTTDGGYALAGATRSFGAGGYDAWLVKTDASGNMMWNKTFGGTSDDGAEALVQTTDGGYAILGDINIGGYGIAYLVKTDSNGNMQWNKNYTELGMQATAWALVQANDGGYVMSGCKEYYDGWLMKTDANGTIQWSRSFVEVNNTQLSSVVQTSDGGYAAVGATQFPPFSGKVDAYVVKTDSDGNMTWSADFSRTSGNDYGRSIVQTSDGGYAIAGETDHWGNADFWLIKTDASGNFLWDRTYGGGGYDCASSIVQTSDGGYALTGNTNSFGAGDNDFWLVKTDASGTMMWNKTYGGASGDDAQVLVQTLDGGYALSGMTSSFCTGGTDFWLVKTDEIGNFGGVESGLAWVDSSANTITLYRGATDPYWNYVRVRLWKPR
jgi:hypothetical protein